MFIGKVSHGNENDTGPNIDPIESTDILPSLRIGCELQGKFDIKQFNMVFLMQSQVLSHGTLQS